MTIARKQQVSVDATPYYHCISRCVRRSFLCGFDPLTNRNYEHRREWVERKLYSLAQIYCIDICAYAIMSNHYHLVVHINRDKALALSDHEVVARWQHDHQLPVLIVRWLARELRTEAEIDACKSIIDMWRDRLWSLSWFMKEINFAISCQANKEDDCKGHFWEGRFRSQALLDDQALIAAMAYVDLNPLRAGVAETPESSDFTSIQARLQALGRQQEIAPCLHPFIRNPTNLDLDGIPMRLMDYIELVDWTARQYREDKASLCSTMPSILQRLNINRENWLEACAQLERKRCTVIGCLRNSAALKHALNRQRINLFRLDS
ncbi:transposase [Vibrio fluminensis]|uniref:transposase n=1 Tax=Vibrio fluminensis TaxID=2783614 RepID=UPI0018890D09|nr:transposase [Vibrio fluminensis]